MDTKKAFEEWASGEQLTRATRLKCEQAVVAVLGKLHADFEDRGLHGAALLKPHKIDYSTRVYQGEDGNLVVKSDAVALIKQRAEKDA